jgi:hypothetical protein
MLDVTIRCRSDGITELAPRLSPLGAGDRWLVIVTVLISAGGFFVCGAIPVGVAAFIGASCVVGEVVLAAKAAVLVLLRPPAPVCDVPRGYARRR